MIYIIYLIISKLNIFVNKINKKCRLLTRTEGFFKIFLSKFIHFLKGSLVMKEPKRTRGPRHPISCEHAQSSELIGETSISESLIRLSKIREDLNPRGYLFARITPGETSLLPGAVSPPAVR
jgi:hypothetical protein